MTVLETLKTVFVIHSNMQKKHAINMIIYVYHMYYIFIFYHVGDKENQTKNSLTQTK